MTCFRWWWWWLGYMAVQQQPIKPGTCRDCWRLAKKNWMTLDKSVFKASLTWAKREKIAHSPPFCVRPEIHFDESTERSHSWRHPPILGNTLSLIKCTHSWHKIVQFEVRIIKRVSIHLLVSSYHFQHLLSKHLATSILLIFRGFIFHYPSASQLFPIAHLIVISLIPNALDVRALSIDPKANSAGRRRAMSFRVASLETIDMKNWNGVQ